MYDKIAEVELWQHSTRLRCFFQEHYIPHPASNRTSISPKL